MVLKHKAKPEFKYGRKVNSKNCLSAMFPNLAEEWDFKKNKTSPDNVHGLANKKVWWKCSSGHNWEQKVTNRATGTQKCPYCTGRITTKNKNIKTDYPNIFKEWDFVKNKNVDPLKIPSGSNKKV